MNVTEDKLKDRQLHTEGHLQMVSAEQKEYAEASACSRIAENTDIITDLQKAELANLGYMSLTSYYLQVCEN